MRSRVIALLAALVAVAALAGQVAAATPPTSDYGNTVECRYKAGGPGPAYNFKLKRLVVKPPLLYAQNGRQRVGWRFVVTRSVNWGSDPWMVTYRSPVQKSMATTTKPASFDVKSVDVALPNVDNLVAVRYHVTLKLFWYRTDGSVKTKLSYQMPWMKWIQNGHYYGDYDDVCQGGFYEGP